MASLAPGNGWFPHQASRQSGPAQHPAPLQATGNVYAFPSSRSFANRGQAAPGPATAARLATLLLADSIKSGRTATWVFGWCLFTLVAATLVWLGLAGVLVAAALFYGVPWATVAVAATLIHALGAALAVLIARRIGRALLLSLETRNRPPLRAA
jgi:hypothetical protein